MILGVAAMLVAIGMVGGGLVGAAALFCRVAQRLGAPADLLCVAALAAGLAGAAALLLAAPDRASLEPARLFAAGGAWHGAGPGEVLVRALPDPAALRGAVAATAGGAPGQVAAGWLSLAALLGGFAVLARCSRGRNLTLGLCAFAILALGTTLAMHAATRLLAWGVAQLGFWLLLLALLALQAWRRRRAAAH